MRGFVLASNSPRRRELLNMLGVGFAVIPSDAEENCSLSQPPHMIVQELALLKGADVAKRLREEIVISADTIVVCDGEIMGKPKDKADAKRMLKKLSAGDHEVYTGICVTDSETGKSVTDFAVTKVEFYDIDDEAIDRYIETGEPMDKAGAYGIQEKGSLFVKGIQGDFFNVVGLPVATLGKVLKEEFDINLI